MWCCGTLPAPYEMLSPDAVSTLTQVFKMFDKNGDGKLDDDERTAMLAFVRNFQERQQAPNANRRNCLNASGARKRRRRRPFARMARP